MLGYPLDGPYTAAPARVRDRIELKGPDIYDAKHGHPRRVHRAGAGAVAATPAARCSTPTGQVIGVVFGAAVDNSETGFVLTADEVHDDAVRAPDLSAAVDTGRCVP